MSTSEHTHQASEANDVISYAHAAENAILELCRATLSRPSLTPAEVDTILANLAAATAALPQVANQLSDILEQAKDEHVLEMDSLTETEDPHLAIGTAQLHLDAVREPALGLYRTLDAARNETAHIAVADRAVNPSSGLELHPPLPVDRPEERQPPAMGAGGGAPGLPR
jgi:hypothetical protein